MAEAKKKQVKVVTQAEKTTRAEIEAIKQENLSGQQLRMARKVAAKHNLDPTSDLDAVRLLRKQGMDPFQSPPMEETHNTQARIGTIADQDRHLPAQRGSSELQETSTISEVQRSQAVMKIQRDLARRRKRRMAQLIARIFFFIMVPTLFAGYYFYFVATPMYSVKSEFMVQSSESPASSASSGLFGGGGGSLFGAEDSVGVQGFLTSPEAMILLDKQHGFRQLFQSEIMDPIQRLDEDASIEHAYKTYKKKVLIGFDPTEGILRMEVIAPTADSAFTFANALLGYAEKRVDEQTERLRGGQVEVATKLRQDAEDNLAAARQLVIALQEKRGVFSGEAEVTVAMGQITTLEGTLQQKRLALAEVTNNARPNQAKVNSLTNQIDELEKSVAELRKSMTAGGEAGETSCCVRLCWHNPCKQWTRP